MIFASVLAIAVLFIREGSLIAGRSCADAVFDLAGRSVLSEYDLTLQKRYGLFAFHTDERRTEEKLKYYCDYSFHDNILNEAKRGRTYMDLLDIDLESVRVTLKGYSITDTDLFEQQVLDCMKTEILRKVLKEKKSYPPDQQNTVLRNEQLINGLPSRGYQASFFTDIEQIAENGLPDLDEIKSGAKDAYLVDEYILGHFLNHQRGSSVKETLFHNEAEYILKGGFNDQTNYNSVKSDIFLLRNGLNLLHIASDPVKQRKVAEVAAAMTLAVGEEIGIPVVAEAWAFAETRNDMQLLEAGEQVAVVKSRDNWAVPISGTLEYILSKEYIQPQNRNGEDYEDYLRILLYLEDREEKLLRCMDLIQLNMKGCYDEGFDLKEYYGGFQFEAVAKGSKFTYIQKY